VRSPWSLIPTSPTQGERTIVDLRIFTTNHHELIVPNPYLFVDIRVIRGKIPKAGYSLDAGINVLQ
jgi:hypothetical protein